jgi:hypothetical protein|tara:strand:+ start:255 stop:668 length:414 start_codon:yes stop_codon:yes gene_type:complete
MADITTTTILSENDRQIVMAFQYQFVDTGNEDAVKKVDVSTLIKNAAGESCTAVRIVEAWWTIFGMTVQVEADASTDVIILHLDENQSGYQDYSVFGGLPKTTAYGSSPTGDIFFTTTGAAAVTDTYQICFRMIKEY